MDKDELTLSRESNDIDVVLRSLQYISRCILCTRYTFHAVDLARFTAPLKLALAARFMSGTDTITRKGAPLPMRARPHTSRCIL
jgi:hypothetical protein